MKKYLLLSVLFCLISCEKEITLSLDPMQSQYVIEGVITNSATTQTVRISKSVDFYDAAPYPAISGATVTVTDGGNSPVAFTETSPGTYTAENFQGIPGHTYTLLVTINNIAYFATSTMPLVVPLDGLAYEENSFNPPGEETNYVVTPKFIDPADEKNFYRFDLVVNGIKDKGFFTLDDNLINGQINTFGISSTDENNTIKSGSTVDLDLIGIDKNCYDYFYVLEQNADSQNTPNNPNSNISGNILGYFSAQNRQTQSVTIP
ncbi:MAG: hypothetical protein CFE23_08285 [Flavobacterium sp. BFFFF1]|uniref:DUF4249 domain-containing protein n=1 Tax=Flavobacterium sp. BFFFF1 TaxID=2015557 RepID=UPI000BD00A04|nr:DUF4249 domain-containing protein [Flavobacterium sp. BFFFF1]OYU80707.1 MAG: hypothetical protein CFE23_08285 [Flavobacterium sp. BFFFF1]